MIRSTINVVEFSKTSIYPPLVKDYLLAPGSFSDFISYTPDIAGFEKAKSALHLDEGQRKVLVVTQFVHEAQQICFFFGII